MTDSNPADTRHRLAPCAAADGLRRLLYPVCRRLERLQADGPDQHGAGHAIGSALAEHRGDLMKAALPTGEPDMPSRAELERVTTEGWRGGR